MECSNYKMMIQEYHDGALSKGAEPLLFTHLSQCSECCDELRALNTLSSIHQAEMKMTDTKIDEIVFREIAIQNHGIHETLFNKKAPAFFVYTLAALLIFVVYLFSSYTNNYKNRLYNALEEIRDLNYNTKLLLEAPQEYVVKAKYAKNEIVIRPKI